MPPRNDVQFTFSFLSLPVCDRYVVGGVMTPPYEQIFVPER